MHTQPMARIEKKTNSKTQHTTVRRPLSTFKFLDCIVQQDPDQASFGHVQHGRRVSPPTPHPRVRRFQQRRRDHFVSNHSLSTKNFGPIEVIGTAREKRTRSTPRFNSNRQPSPLPSFSSPCEIVLLIFLCTTTSVTFRCSANNSCSSAETTRASEGNA